MKHFHYVFIFKQGGQRGSISDAQRVNQHTVILSPRQLYKCELRIICALPNKLGVQSKAGLLAGSLTHQFQSLVGIDPNRH